VRANELVETTEIGSFVDELEELFATLQCELLDTLSPDQFMKVQRLVEAGQVMTEAQCMLGVLASVRSTSGPRSTVCRPRRFVRRTASSRFRTDDSRAIGA
jgi:hypothetical protein